MVRKKLALAAAILLIIVLAAGCANKEEPKPEQKEEPEKVEQVIRYNIGAEPETMDPAKMKGVIEGTITNALFEGLMRYDANNTPQPGLAESYNISGDGLVYTFKLREARWTNGDPVTADDFKYAWLRALSPEIAADYAYQLWYIKGAAAYSEGEGKAEDVAIKVADPKTIEVTLEAPAHQFLGLTSFQTFYPLNKKVVEANPEWAASPENYVSNGPFKFVNWEHNQKITLVKNPDYWDAASVKLEKLEIYLLEDDNTAYTMYRTGQLDFVDSVLTQEIPNLKGNKDFKIFPDTSVYFYMFNCNKEPTSDPRVRKALAMAIDRTAIVEKITQAGQKPAFAYVPYGYNDADPAKDFREVGGNSFFKEDIAEAKRLLAEAGYPEGKGFPRLDIKFNTRDEHQKIAQAIQEMWKQNLGIEVSVKNQEWQSYVKDMVSINFDILRSGWMPDYLDPMTFMDMLVSDGGNNFTGWGNAGYDELIRKANSTGDNNVRMKAMHEAEAILMEELPIMPIYFYTNPDIIRDNIKGVVVPPFNIYAEFKWAYVE